MPRQCQRPDCADRAAVAYRFDPQRQIVVLDGLADANTPASGVLCARHAAAMVLPKGWWLDDRRVARPSLFGGGRGSVTEIDRGVSPRVRRARRARPVVEAAPELLPREPTPEPVVTAEAVAPAESAADDAESVNQWTPDFDVQDDLGGLLKAESPLLSRAFGGRVRKGKKAPRE